MLLNIKSLPLPSDRIFYKMTSGLEEAIRVFSKPIVTRTTYECKALVPWLRQLSPLLEPHPFEMLIEFIRHCQYQQAVEDHVLIWRGKFVQSYYLIMKGLVSLHLDNVQMREDVSSASVDSLKRREDGDRSASEASRSIACPRQPQTERTNEETVPGFGDTLKKFGQRAKLGKSIISYGTGECLFDCSVLFDAKPVGMTAICDQTTHLLLIDNEFFSNHLKYILREEVLNIRTVIQSHPLFSTVPQRLHTLLITCMRQERFTFDSIVIRQGDKVEKIVIIRSGQAKILINRNRHESQYHHLWPFEKETQTDNKFSREPLLLGKYVQHAGLASIKRRQVAIRRKDGYVGAEKWLKDRIICLRTVLSGEVLGDIELSLGLSTYLQTIRTLHHTTVYVMSVKGLEAILGRPIEQEAVRNEAFGRHVCEKLKNRMIVKYGEQVPLLKYLHDVLSDALEMKTIKNKNKASFLKVKKKPKRQERKGKKVTLFDNHLPLITFKEKIEIEDGQVTESVSSQSTQVSLSNSSGDGDTVRRRVPRLSIFERLYANNGEENTVTSDGEKAGFRRHKKRRWNGRSVLQVREAIQQKITEEKMKTHQRAEARIKAKGKNQVVTQTTNNREFNPGDKGTSPVLANLDPSINSSDFVSRYLEARQRQEEKFSTTMKKDSNQIPVSNPSEKKQGIFSHDNKNSEDILINSNARHKFHLNQQAPHGTFQKLPQVPEETEPIQLHPGCILPPLTLSTGTGKNSFRNRTAERNLITSEGTKISKTLSFGKRGSGRKGGGDEREEELKEEEKEEESKEEKEEELKEEEKEEESKEEKEEEEKEEEKENSKEEKEEEEKEEEEKATKAAIDLGAMVLGGTQRERMNYAKRINRVLGFNQFEASKIKLAAIGLKGSNYESSHHFLCDLEERLRQFHQENLNNKYKYTLKLPSLKRYEEIEFEVDGETYDGPRPGGKVLIRKRKCRFQGFFAHVKNHKHVHYHMVDSLPNLPIIDSFERTGNE